jgi:hypothetical protein
MSGHLITDADLSAASEALAVLTDIAPTQAADGDLQAAADYASRTRNHDAQKTIRGILAAQRVIRIMIDHKARKRG